MESPHVRLAVRSYPDGEDTHIHDFHQVVLPLAGTMDIEVDGDRGAVSHRRGVMIAGGARHVFRVRGANRFIVLDLRFNAMGRIAGRPPFFDVDEMLAELARYAGKELMSGSLDRAEDFHLTMLMAAKIDRCLSRAALGLGPVERALAVMRAAHAERLTVGQMARVVGLGPTRFHELFRQNTGRTPGELLAEIRLDHAEELLVHTRLPIAEIALLTGFSEQSALTRSLRRRRGTTPRALRGNAERQAGRM